MNSEALKLIQLAPHHQAVLLAMLEEFEAAGERHFHLDLEQSRQNIQLYLQNLEDMASGIGLKAGIVPETTFWLVKGRSYFIGLSRLRPRLTPTLKHHGGHIGYAIRPAERRQGYATRLLKLTLDKARESGLQRVLLTCDTDNLASVRVIEKNGGALENQVVSNISGNLISRYWIAL